MDPKTSNTGTSNAFRSSLHGLPYTETIAQQPPIRIKSSTSPQPTDGQPQPTGRSPDQASTPTSAHLLTTKGETNRSNGSGYGDGNGNGNGHLLSAAMSPSLTNLDNHSSLLNPGDRSPNSLTSSWSIPQITFDQPLENAGVAEDAHGKPDEKNSFLKTKPKSVEQPPLSGFKALTLDLPTGNGLADELNTDSMKFSKRGSMLLDGKKVAMSNSRRKQNTPLDTIHDTGQQSKRITIADTPTPKKRPSPRPRPAAKALTVEEEGLSEKVRSFYAVGSDAAYDSDAASSIANKIGNRWQDTLGVKTEASSLASLSRDNSTTDIHHNADKRTSAYQREELELAGGIEDWQDVDNADVDRYGFIIPKQDSINVPSRSGTVKDRTGVARVATTLQLASEQPRRKGTVRRAPGSSHGPRSPGMLSTPSEKSLPRPQSSPSGGISRHSTFRSRDQKAVDQAGDMLTLPRTASMLIGTGESASEDPRARRKEIEREEKWRRMARPIPSKNKGGGMTFSFDTTSPKLIERTWKGIPDKWRASAWHAFLSASARKHKDSLPDDDLIAIFDDYQTQPSPDDVQIDIDVPRTISSHIMFRRRYRGGQRLLFRVLHAMSLHFPTTGYVQGMAALAATLLAYYPEDMTFVMLVRLWELRGLDKLYKSGFGGLMAALNDFEKDWLGDGSGGLGEVGARLEGLGVGTMSYGTRWYLTLFNYSVPFSGMLRVWDVFMLLGDDDSEHANGSRNPGVANGASQPTRADQAGVNSDIAATRDGNKDSDPDLVFGTTLDVLHATSAALIDGMRDILVESDFEGSMKVLTSWIPIKDEDMLMRVAKAEWKNHQTRLKRQEKG